jgi:hypothetical protein
MIYLYALVSTDGQRVDAQVRQLRTANCEKVFRETANEAVRPIPVGRSIALGCFQFLRNRVVFRLVDPRVPRVQNLIWDARNVFEDRKSEEQLLLKRHPGW